MFEIIIIFIIISVLGSILRGIGQAGRGEGHRQALPRGATDDQSPRVRGTRLHINRRDTAKADAVNERPDHTDRRINFSAEEPYSNPSRGFDTQQRTNPEHFSDRRKDLSFSRNSIINGIILSEILQPPKARRRG